MPRKRAPAALATARDALAWLQGRGPIDPIVRHAFTNAWRPAVGFLVAGADLPRALVGGLMVEALLRVFVVGAVNQRRADPPEPILGLRPYLPSSKIALQWMRGQRGFADVAAGTLGRAAMILPVYLAFGLPWRRAMLGAVVGATLIEYAVIRYLRAETRSTSGPD